MGIISNKGNLVNINELNILHLEINKSLEEEMLHNVVPKLVSLDIKNSNSKVPEVHLAPHKLS